MKSILQKLKKIPWPPIFFILLVILFFSIRLVITYDSAHYLSYVSIFEGTLPASSWDIVRGPIFPVIILIFNTLFGKTSAGILVGTFIFYATFSIVCYKTCKEICKNFKHKRLIQDIVIAILILNPLIMGYFHVLLTEFIAITLTMLNIFIAYKWISCDTRNKKSLVLYAVYFILSTIFCYHLKQSYIIIALIPPITSAIISIMLKHSLKNILYRAGTIVTSIILLISSIIIWNKVLVQIGADTNTGRDSSSLFSQQILEAYQISYDINGDNQTDALSTSEAISILFQNFLSNPPRIIGIYFNNYCGLTSVCSIATSDSVHYISTSNIAGLDTFENSAIAYRPYSNSSNIFVMSESLYSRSSVYGENSNRSFIAAMMNIFRIPTNLLFKFSTLSCIIFLILLIMIKAKFKDADYNHLFYLNLILLTTSSLHLALSAGIGLIIDRYAIEAFIPSALGIFGTISYYILSAHNLKINYKKNKSNKKRKTKK